MNEFVELRRLINIVLKRWWLLVGLTAIAAMLGYTISQRQTPVYQATVTVLVGEVTKSTNLSRDDVQLSALFAQTYADLAVRQPVLQGVVVSLDLDETWEDLRKRVRVESIKGTQLVEIKAEANSPEMARTIADEVAKHLIIIGPTSLSDREESFVQSFINQQMEETKVRILNGQKRIQEIDASLAGSITAPRLIELQAEKTNLERLIADNVLNFVELSNLAEQDRSPNSLSILETAYSEKDPIRPNVNLNILLSSGLGMLFALSIIFILEFMNDAVKSTDDLSQFEKLNILGTVGKIKGHSYSGKLVTHLDPSSATTEAYHMIQNKIRFGLGENPAKTIVITSPEPEDGKSTTAANLGIIMAQANYKTILVDADLRHPVLHRVFNVKNKTGLADLINAPETDIRDCLKSTPINNLLILPGGELTQGQSVRLNSERLSEILKRLDPIADTIIIDGPPALLTADAMILANGADGTIVVIRAGKSKRKAIRQTLMDLQEANANLLGFIFNETHKSQHYSPSIRHKQEKNLIQHLRALVNILF